jgi:hypothetical protein
MMDRTACMVRCLHPRTFNVFSDCRLAVACAGRRRGVLVSVVAIPHEEPRCPVAHGVVSELPARAVAQLHSGPRDEQAARGNVKPTPQESMRGIAPTQRLDR